MTCRKIYNARAQLLFCSLNLLFSSRCRRRHGLHSPQCQHVSVVQGSLHFSIKISLHDNSVINCLDLYLLHLSFSIYFFENACEAVTGSFWFFLVLSFKRA